MDARCCESASTTLDEKTLHLRVDERLEVLRVPPTTAKTVFIDLVRAVAEAAPGDVVKVCSATGALLNATSELAPNSPETPYSLRLVATNCQSMLQRELGVDLIALDQRVSDLERMVQPDDEDVCKAVSNLRRQVETFRFKLEATLPRPGSHKINSPVRDNWVTLTQANQLYFKRRSAEERLVIRHKFLKICEVSASEELRLRLRQVTFDSREWEDEELLMLMQQMFLDLELTTTFGLDLPTLRTFLFTVYDNYNDVPFHNFRHCFCVAQMMYSVIWAADLRNRLGDLEVLILITSCICHDLDHPGYNNIYQINAHTELALRYNDISPLENHHCSMAFRILCRPECNILKGFSGDQFRQVREGVIRCILATDMARHNEILDQFKQITPVFDFANLTHANLLTMVLIKVADISNEARPMEVAEPWLDRLLQEFFEQSDAEKMEGLPVTPFMDRDKVTKPSSQCSFIGLVLLPLFEALVQLLPELHEMIIKPVHFALDHYRRLNEAARERKSLELELSDVSSQSATDSSAIVPAEAAKRVSLSEARLSRSSIHSCAALIASRTASLEEYDDDVTEVDVSERALKFKISTEPNKNFRRESMVGRQGSVDEVEPPENKASTASGSAKKHSSLFSKLQMLRERLNNSSPLNRLSYRRKSSSSSDLKVDAAATCSSPTDKKLVLSGSLGCVLGAEQAAEPLKKQRLFQRLRGADSPTKAKPTKQGKVSSFVGSFRKNRRDDKTN